MSPQNGQAQVPPDGYIDNPRELDEFLMRYPLRFNFRDLRNLAIQNNTPVSLDDLLSRELLQLSLQDRNAINEEIHGVQTFAPEETPDMLEEALSEMAVEIDNIPIKTAFDRSQEFSKTYVNSADFRLRFLRSDLFEAKKAAKRMVRFLDLLAELFGDFALRRQVQMSDFSR
mmetsp:Transcript_14138/g.29467  ORF Transcript_14138/g.29467 Transcript_14138/m.29467 type:complete len:172 (+) Transcript_14138:136-651(+)